MSGASGGAPSEDPLLGFRVLRRFAGFGEFWGTIIASRRIDGARHWYRVDYDDGDSEEYNLREVQRMAEYACSKQAHDPQGPPKCGKGTEALAKAAQGLAALEDEASGQPSASGAAAGGSAPGGEVTGRARGSLAASSSALLPPPVVGSSPHPPAPGSSGAAFDARELEVDLLDMGFQAVAVRDALARHGADKDR
jgi:hypothetical protein